MSAPALLGIPHTESTNVQPSGTAEVYAAMHPAIENLTTPIRVLDPPDAQRLQSQVFCAELCKCSMHGCC